MTVDSARRRLTDRPAVAVPYRCRISGHEETLVLVSRAVARRLAATSEVLRDAADAVLTAAVVHTELCVCDLATLAALDEVDAHARLTRLVDAGLLEFRVLDGMNYFRLADGAAGREIRDLVTTLVGDPR